MIQMLYLRECKVSNQEIVTQGCFDLVITQGGSYIRLNVWGHDKEGCVVITPILTVFPELEYQVNEMATALQGIVDEMRERGRTKALWNWHG